MKLHLFQFRENGFRFLQLTRNQLRLRDCHCALDRVAMICGGCLLSFLRLGTRVVVAFLLLNFLVVGNVSWIGHPY